MTRGGGGGVAPAVSLDPPQRVLALHAGHRSQGVLPLPLVQYCSGR